MNELGDVKTAIYIYICIYICVYICIYICVYICLFVWIAGEQRRLCKPPTGSEIAGGTKTLYQSPMRKLWECRDGLLYAWRYTYILTRKCGVH